MLTSQLKSIIATTDEINLMGVTAELLTAMEHAGIDDLNKLRVNICRRARESGIDENAAEMAWLMARDIERGGFSECAELDGRRVEIAIDLTGVKIRPMRPGVNYGAAM